jgi:hypothetical protein
VFLDAINAGAFVGLLALHWLAVTVGFISAGTDAPASHATPMRRSVVRFLTFDRPFLAACIRSLAFVFSSGLRVVKVGIRQCYIAVTECNAAQSSLNKKLRRSENLYSNGKEK